MSEKFNAVIHCRDSLENKNSMFGFVVYEGDDPVVKEMYQKTHDKIKKEFGDNDELTLCRIHKTKKEFEALHQILSKSYGYQTSEIKSQDFEDWVFEAFASENMSREEFDKFRELSKEDNQ